MSKKPLYVIFSRTVDAYHSCLISRNEEWLGVHKERLLNLAKNHLPSGGGINSGTTFDIFRSSRKKLIFHTGFHHMNEAGFPDGWTHHTIIVRPEFGGINLSIGGKNRNNVKEYLHDVFYEQLRKEIDKCC